MEKFLSNVKFTYREYSRSVCVLEISLQKFLLSCIHFEHNLLIYNLRSFQFI